MRKAVLMVIGSLAAGPVLADGYWDGRDPSTQVPLESFLDATVPTDGCWKVRIAESLRGKPMVAPPASVPWRDRLRAAGTFNKFEVAVDEGACVVAISNPRPVVAPAAAPPAPSAAFANSASAPPPPATSASGAAPAMALPPLNAAPASIAAAPLASAPLAEMNEDAGKPAFGLRSGTTLRPQVEEWARSVDWQVEWTLPYDYPITATAFFGHDLYEAVKTLVASYERVGQMRDVEWVFNGGNRVLVVRPVDRFMQAGRQNRAGRDN